MKTLKRIIVLIVCFMLLSTSFVKSSAVGEEETAVQDVLSYSHYLKNLDEYSVSMLATACFMYADTTPFGITDKIRGTYPIYFLALEDLPYGENSTVISFRFADNGTVVHFIVNSQVETDYSCFYSSSGSIVISLLSKDKIYRVGYLSKGTYAAILGVEGIALCDNALDANDENDSYLIEAGYTSFLYSISRDVYTTISSNNNLIYHEVSDGENVEFNYLLSNYPTAAALEQYGQLEIRTGISGIWDSITELPSKIASSIKGFFTELGDKIGGFFESLKNYLLYFQETKPEHVNPFAGILDDVQSFFDEQIGDTEDFKASLDETLNKVSSYIETGSNIINKVLDGVPILNAFVIFILVLAVVRKVVGR